MTNSRVNTEAIIQEYNKQYRKSKVWKSINGDLLRYCKVKPYKMGFKNVFIGMLEDYCEFKYRAVNNKLEVVSFNSKTVYQREIGGEFSNEKARKGINYLLGLAEQLGTSTIIIELLYILPEDHEIFYDFNFSFRPNELTGGAFFMLSLK